MSLVSNPSGLLQYRSTSAQNCVRGGLSCQRLIDQAVLIIYLVSVSVPLSKKTKEPRLFSSSPLCRLPLLYPIHPRSWLLHSTFFLLSSQPPDEEWQKSRFFQVAIAESGDKSEEADKMTLEEGERSLKKALVDLEVSIQRWVS